MQESAAANAVTWGVFPGKEVVQPTVVDQQSFLVWKVCCRLTLPSPSGSFQTPLIKLLRRQRCRQLLMLHVHNFATQAQVYAEHVILSFLLILQIPW